MGRGACWCVTFFSLCGLLVVKAIQNSPCWCKMRRKWVFRACWESFVPVGLVEAASRESFVPTPAPRAVQSSPCSGKTGQKGRFRVCWESFVPVGPARPMCRESFVPVGPAELDTPGEFCTGWARRGCEPGEFCTDTGPACGTKFSLLGENRSKRAVSGVLGEFCTGPRRGRGPRRPTSPSESGLVTRAGQALGAHGGD